MARILIADDEALERSALRMIISSSGEAEGIEIDEASNGHEALTLVDVNRYDAFFLDVKMPGLDGLAAAEAIRARGILAPIVIISAFDTFEYAQRAIRLGVYEYLLKPAGSDEVRATLQRVLAARREETAIGDSGSGDANRDSRGRAGADIPYSGAGPRDSSIRAVSEALSRLERSILERLSQGSVDGALVRDYARLAGLEETWMSVLAFRIAPRQDRDAGRHAGSLAAVMLSSMDREGALRCRKSFAAAGAGGGHLILYHDGAEIAGAPPSPAPRPPRPEPGHSGFLRMPEAGPLAPLLDALVRKARETAPMDIMIGVAGPVLHGDPEELFSQAGEAARLADPERPIVHISPLPVDGAAGTVCFSSGNAAQKSLGSRALEIIKRRYPDDLSLASAAEELGVNAFHLSRSVSRDLGMGFSEVLARVRINRAKELLLGGSSVKEAGYLVGYRDQAYFTRVFRKLEGMNPSEYLRQSARKYKK